MISFFFRLVEKLQEKSPDQVDIFKTNTNKVMKDILGRFKDLQFFTGNLNLSVLFVQKRLFNLIYPRADILNVSYL